jgi:hypothetical protein
MRWYFAIDEAGGLGHIGAYAKLAVRTARAIGGLEPRLLYYGNPTSFTGWMTANGVEIIQTAPSFLATIKAAEAAGTFHAHSIGHWLRLAIPEIEQAHDYVLYTDCDVIFLRPFNWQSIRPRVFSAAPEFKPDNWNYFNSGVMLLNVPAMRATYPAFESHIRARLNTTYNYDDQWALNEVYRGKWDQLDPICNTKPYWPFNRHAAILHFHGPKLDALEAIAAGAWARHDDTARMLGKMLDAHIDHYITWCNLLGDTLQNIDLATAIRYLNLASALTRYRAKLAPVTDTDFMTLKMFPD